MDPSAPIPFHARAAYGLPRPGGTASGSTPRAQFENGRIVPPFAERRDHVSVSVGNLVAGAVESPVSQGRGFEGVEGVGGQVRPIAVRAANGESPAPTSRLQMGRNAASPVAFAMYTRAADRLEVATDLAVGRALDVRG